MGQHRKSTESRRIPISMTVAQSTMAGLDELSAAAGGASRGKIVDDLVAAALAALAAEAAEKVEE